MEKLTTIQVTKETRSELAKLKIVPGETYEHMLRRVVLNKS
jgi:hypothetical protein